MASRLSPPDTELNTELRKFLVTNESAKEPLAFLRARISPEYAALN